MEGVQGICLAVHSLSLQTSSSLESTLYLQEEATYEEIGQRDQARCEAAIAGLKLGGVLLDPCQ